MCKKCLIYALTSGLLTVGDVLQTKSLQEAIELAQSKMPPPVTPADWLAQTQVDLEMSIKAQQVSLNYLRGDHVGRTMLSMNTAMNRSTGEVMIVAIFGTEAEGYTVDEVYHAYATLNHTWQAPTFEVAEHIADSIMARIEAEANATEV